MRFVVENWRMEIGESSCKAGFSALLFSLPRDTECFTETTQWFHPKEIVRKGHITSQLSFST